MRSFREMPIKQKLMVIVMLTTAAALLLSGVGIMVLDSLLYRASLERDLSALSRIVSDNSTAALSFDDQRAAAETLAALRAKSHLIAACIYRPDGTIFARYSRAAGSHGCPPAPAGEGVNVARGEMTAWRPVVLQGRPIGRIVLLSDLGEIADRIRLYGATVLLMLLASSLIAFFLSSKLRALIATPISQLVAATTSVSETRDYSVRVQKMSSDELGVLVDAFNDMLAAIHSRDTELTKALAARQEAFEAAETARNSLQTTLASIGDAVISTDIDGRIVFANPVAQALLGWPEAELRGKPLDEVFRIINEFGRGPLESPVTKVLREGKSVGLARHTILIARDGTEIPIDNSGAPIQHEGRTVGVVLVFRDVSERRRAERDTAYLAALVESTGDAIIGSSPDGVIQSWNPAAERLYGYRAEEMIGHSTRDLTPPDHAHEESAIFERLRHGDRMVHLETVRQCKGGAMVDVSLTISPIRDDTGQIMGISHLARDITEQKRNAEKLRQTQKLESIGILAGGIAHDFNNLLSGHHGQCQPGAGRARSGLAREIAAGRRDRGEREGGAVDAPNACLFRQGTVPAGAHQPLRANSGDHAPDSAGDPVHRRPAAGAGRSDTGDRGRHGANPAARHEHHH